jgi:hypothetical protein
MRLLGYAEPRLINTRRGNRTAQPKQPWKRNKCILVTRRKKLDPFPFSLLLLSSFLISFSQLVFSRSSSSDTYLQINIKVHTTSLGRQLYIINLTFVLSSSSPPSTSSSTLSPSLPFYFLGLIFCTCVPCAFQRTFWLILIRHGTSCHISFLTCVPPANINHTPPPPPPYLIS